MSGCTILRRIGRTRLYLNGSADGIKMCREEKNPEDKLGLRGRALDSDGLDNIGRS